MSKHTEAMKLALKALEWNMCYLPSYGSDTAMAINAITALRKALAEQPAQRTWVGLMDKDITETFDEVPSAQDDPWWLRYARVIEAKLREKNT